jgi:hypothetical protein
MNVTHAGKTHTVTTSDELLDLVWLLMAEFKRERDLGHLTRVGDDSVRVPPIRLITTAIRNELNRDDRT